MKYIAFILKKIRRDKLNLLPFVIMAGFIIFIYVGNQKSMVRDLENPDFSGENEMLMLEESVKTLEKELTDYEPSSKEYETSMDHLDMENDRLGYLQGKVEGIKNEDWNSYFSNDAQLTRITLERVEKTQGYDTELIEVLKTNIKYDEYMTDHSLEYDSRFNNIRGVSYGAKVIGDFLPIMLAIVLIFITSKLYCSCYFDDFDIQNLLPYSKFKKQSLQLCSGTIFGICIVAFVSIISLLCGSVGSSFGSFTTPILTYTAQGADVFVSLQSILPQVLILLLLSIIFITNFVSLIATLTKKRMVCLLISLAIILGFLIVLQDLVPLQKYIHLFPTTYLKTIKVVSGELSYLSNHGNVTFINGCIVLLLANLAVFLMNYYVPKIKFRSVKS